jgi:hypothetical protein
MSSLKIKLLIVLVLCCIAYTAANAADDVTRFAASCAVLSSTDEDTDWWILMSDAPSITAASKEIYFNLTEVESIEDRDELKETYELLRVRCHEAKIEITN